VRDEKLKILLSSKRSYPYSDPNKSKKKIKADEPQRKTLFELLSR